MSKKPCTKKTIKETLKEIFLTSWAFTGYATFFHILVLVGLQLKYGNLAGFHSLLQLLT